MLVLIQVSSTKTRRSGSRWRLSACQRARLRATAARACSVANRVLFLKLSPSRLRKRQMVSRLTAIPAAASSSRSRSMVRCGVSPTSL